MNYRYRICCILLLLLSISVFTEETVHILQRGDTIYSIARSYGVDFQEILKLNSIDDPTKLQVGQRIRIPQNTPASGSSAAAAPVEHRVARGETLYGIARKYEITLQSLRAENKLSDSFVLKEGDILRIPGQTAAPAAPSLVTAQPDTASPGANTPIPALPSVPDARVTTAPRPVDASVRWPVQAKEILYMTGKLYGVVLTGEKSESVRSLTQGTVISAGPYRGFGRVAIVQRTGGYLYVYGGCESLTVKEGDRVGPGTELGKLGVDALSAKPQLFFLVYQSNNPIDPAKAPRA
ncbi:M23 family metallopeptidase [Breznakiella homolactica]|uniref:M23 family metallopeptidase n=1 Tax=Breznakiella homolactica TaxID=2798577 RepID=A0A7T7XLT3_9SPIR|nr:M23 family metallopeptidase [Breznakiella homolactica]QQO08563.1 M23 family metallopeptidase [Breznakiella homolactica]